MQNYNNFNKKRKRNNQGQRYYEDPSLIQDTGDDHSTNDYHSSPHYPNPSIHSPTPSPTVISQNLSNEQIYTVDPPLPTPSIPDAPQQSRSASGTTNANQSTYVSVITEPVDINSLPDNSTSNDQPIDSATAQRIIDAIERGDDVVPLNMGGLEDMEL